MNYKKYNFSFSGTNGMVRQVKQQIQKYCNYNDIEYKFADCEGLIFGDCDVVLKGDKNKIDYLVKQLEEYFE